MDHKLDRKNGDFVTQMAGMLQELLVDAIMLAQKPGAYTLEITVKDPDGRLVKSQQMEVDMKPPTSKTILQA